MPLIYGGAIALGGALSFLGGRSQASAQQRMAESQERAAQAAVRERRAEREMALRFAEPSTAELEARQQFLQLQQQVLGRTQRELSFLQRGLDLTAPGAAEAGQGLFSSMLARQRAQQRAGLESQLRQRFGAGFGSTSAGQAALQRFDMATADLGVQAIPQFLQQAYGAIGASTGLEQAIKNRQIAAAQATAVSPFSMQAAQMAGASNVGAIQGGAALSQFGNVISNVGGQMLGYQMQGKMFGDLIAQQQNRGVPVVIPQLQAPQMIAPAQQSARFSLGNYQF